MISCDPGDIVWRDSRDLIGSTSNLMNRFASGTSRCSSNRNHGLMFADVGVWIG